MISARCTQEYVKALGRVTSPAIVLARPTNGAQNQSFVSTSWNPRNERKWFDGPGIFCCNESHLIGHWTFLTALEGVRGNKLRTKVVTKLRTIRSAYTHASTGLLALSMMLSACGRMSEQTRKPNVDADAAAIAKTFAEYVSAWEASDAGRIANLYCDDAVILPGDHREESGRVAITKFNKNFFDQFSPGSFEISAQDRKIIGDWAFENGAYTFTATPKPGGQAISDRGKYLVILQRQSDGSWRWFRDIDNSDGPPAPAGPNK